MSRSPEQSEGEAKQSSLHIPSPLVGEGKGGGDLTSELIHLTFLNANPDPEIITEGRQEGKVNYFIGNDPEKWKTNIPTYNAVVYKEVYPGIDIKFYGNNRQMEYDIIVKPWADPSEVRLAYEGIEGLEVTEHGDLEVILKEGSIIQKKPVIYQEIDGKRVAVDGWFVIGKNVAADYSLRSHGDIANPEGSKQSQILPSPLMGEGRVGVTPVITSPPLLKGGQGGLTPQFTYTFEVAAYDRDHTLVIDPVLVYSTYLGGSWDDFGGDIAVDAAGNAYIMGWAVSENFPATSGAYDTTHNGGWWDEFIVKLDASGSSLVYATYLGGNGYDYGNGIAVDASGNLYITGATCSTNFPTTTGAYDTTYHGICDVFVVKLNQNGSALLYSTLVGGSDNDGGGGISLDGSGNAYVTGYTNSTDFPTTSGAYDVTPNGGYDGFVLKVNPTGTALSYSTLIGGSGRDGTYHIGVDVSGNVYIAGDTSSTDFPTTTPGAYDTTFNGGEDVFVAKLNTTGSALSYSTFLGGGGDETASGISVDASGNAYVTGGTSSSNFPTTPGAYNTIYNGGSYDGFVAKLDAAGSVLSYSTYLGGSNWDYGRGIAVDSFGNAYVTGETNSSNFPTTTGAYDTTFNGGSYDGFLAKIDASDSILTGSTYIGGSNLDVGGKIALDASGNAYVIGRTESSDFPATTGAYDTTPNGMSDVFVAKIAFGTPTITYNPTTDFSIYNGNPNGVWSYGWMPNDFSTFNLYTGSHITANTSSPQWYREPASWDYSPTIWRNDSDSLWDGVAPGQLSLHPSSSYEPSVLRWTAPSDGLYNFAGQFLPGDGNPMQVGIRQGSNWLWQGVDSGSFNFDRLMTAGQSIDFLVYGAYWAGNTPLELTITTSDTAVSPSILFSDDFNDNYIDTTKWDYGWDRVLESDGIMKVETTVTDGGGRLWSKWIDISSNNTITITRKANLHYSNNYFNGTLRMLFDTNNDGIPDIGFGVEYANDLYATGQYCPRYGFYIIRDSFGWYDGSYLCSKGSDISESIEPVWDTWFDEKIIYNSSTGVLEYFVNGQKKTELNVGILPPADSYKMQLDFQAWGWWTGHYQYFDDIVVTQNRTTQNVSLDFSNWMKMECGPWEDTAEGLKVYGTDYRIHNQINSKSAYNFISKELFIKWKANNGGSFSAFGPGLFGVLDLGDNFSSPNACCQTYTKAISNDTWYYTRIKINPDKTAQHVTSTNDYDINGGTVFASGTKTISDAQWRMVDKTNIFFRSGDTYAGSNAYFVVGEVITDATPVTINFGSTTTYDFEDGTIPSSFYSTGNWTIANDGYNSSRSLYINTSQTSTISLDVTDAVAVSFKIRVNAPTYSGSGFEIIGQRTYWWAGEDFLCWNDIYFNIYGSGTKTLKWSLFNNGSGGGEAWVDDIKIYYSTPPITPIDSDNDGYTSDVDCNDNNASINPGATEICNSIDDNCDGLIDEGCAGVEVCDGMDNDNDGQIDEGFPDTDGDGNADCVDTDDDNDGVTDVNEISAGSDPLNAASTPEVCDGVDNDLDGLTDEGCQGSPTTPEGTNVEVIPTENLALTFDNVTTSGATTVTTSGTGQPPPSGFRLGSPPVYYDITTTATYSGPIQVCLSYDETQFATERNLRLFHLEGGGWVDITDPGYPDTTNNIICGTTTSLSPFIIAEELSTAVTLQNISAHLDGNQVILTWSTSFELNNEGFIILRAESPSGPFTPITQGMIPAMGGSGKATYTFTDSNIEQGKTYYYQLQDIDSRGQGTSHRAIPVTVAFARAGEPSQGSTNHKDITARNQQKTDAAVDKESVENKLYESSEPAAWISVVESNNDIISAGLETKPAEDAMAETRISAGTPSQYNEKFQQGIESERQTSPETLFNVRDQEVETQHPISGSSSFSVSIEDDKGNIIMVRKLEDTANTSTPGSDIEISEESGRIVLTWQGHGKAKAKGFILHRKEKGKDTYTPITSLIPYFGRDDKDIFLYRFTDNSVKPGVKYDYRLEMVEADHKQDLTIGKLSE